MAYVRLVHPRHYSPDRKRFTSVAYKNLHGGMSVFVEDCAVQKTGSICAHAAQWYQGIVGTPIVFFFIQENEVPVGAAVAQTLSTSGDDCHRDITGATNGQLKAAYQGKDFYVCDGGAHRPMTEADAAAF